MCCGDSMDVLCGRHTETGGVEEGNVRFVPKSSVSGWNLSEHQISSLSYIAGDHDFDRERKELHGTNVDFDLFATAQSNFEHWI